MLYLKATLATVAETEILKNITHQKRPCDVCPLTNRSCVCYKSFPSGHTSFAFASPSYEFYRYGLKSSIPGYIAASMVGYSRVHGKRHHWRDVIAGALLAQLNAYLGMKISGLSLYY